MDHKEKALNYFSQKMHCSQSIIAAFLKCGNLRIDTHGDNIVMQNLLKKLGFNHCGTIYVEEDNYPRLAFEKFRVIEE